MSAKRPTRTAVRWFLALMGLCGAVALGGGVEWLSTAAVSRALGLLLGACLLTLGNWLPKLRPLQRSGRVPAGAAASERLAGWALVCAGLTMDGLLLFAAPERARPAAALAGFAALAVVAVDWLWLLWTSRGGAGTRPAPAEPEARRLVASLLFALAYVCATGCAAMLSGEPGRRDGWGAWQTVAFCAAYAVLHAALGPGPSARRRRGLSS
jgi:hypothetical protein